MPSYDSTQVLAGRVCAEPVGEKLGTSQPMDTPVLGGHRLQNSPEPEGGDVCGGASVHQ